MARLNTAVKEVNEGYDPPSTHEGAAGDGDAPDDWFDARSSRFSNALLHATTIPKGTTEFSLISEYYEENFEFYAEDRHGNGDDFLTDDFFEWTTAFEVSHALTNQLEIEISIAPEQVRHVRNLAHGQGAAACQQPLFETLQLQTFLPMPDGTITLLGMHSLETARAGEAGTDEERAAVRDRRVLVFVIAKVKKVE